MTLGQKLRERRRNLSLTLKDVADVAEISIPYLSDVERDKAQPPIKTLLRIAQALEVSVAHLLQGVELDGDEIEDVSLPEGLRELRDDPVLGAEFADVEWVRTLMRVDYRGERPKTKQDWWTLHQTLKMIYRSKEDS